MKQFRFVLILLFAFSLYLVNGRPATIQDFCEVDHNPFDPITPESYPDHYERIMKMTKDCISVQAVPLKRNELSRDDPHLHISVMKSHNCQIHRIHDIRSMIMGGGSTDYAEDRLPVGTFTVDHLQPDEYSFRLKDGPLSACQNQYELDKGSTLYHIEKQPPNKIIQLQCRRNSLWSTKTDFYNEIPAKFIRFVGDKSTTNDDFPKHLNWHPIFCVLWTYFPPKEIVENVRFPYTHLDLIVELTADFPMGGGSIWRFVIILNQVNFAKYSNSKNYDTGESCRRMSEFSRTHNKDHYGDKAIMKISDMCSCTSPEMDANFKYLFRGDGRVVTRRAEGHYDDFINSVSHVSKCLNVKIIGKFEDPSIFYVTIGIKRSSCIKNVNGYPYMTILENSNVVFNALDTNGLVFGTWKSFTKSNPDWLICGEFPDLNLCTTKGEDKYFVDLKQKFSPGLCLVPPGYIGYGNEDPTIREPEDHEYGILRTNYPNSIPPLNSDINNYGFIVGMKLQYTKSEHVHRFQIVAQIPIMRSLNQSRFYPAEIITIRSPVYKLIINNGEFSYQEHPDQTDIQLNKIYDISKRKECSQPIPPGPPTTSRPTTTTGSPTYPPPPPPPDVIVPTTNKDGLKPGPTTMPENHEDIYDGCRETKGCLAPPRNGIDDPMNCVLSRTCEMVVAYGKTKGEDNLDDELVLEMYHPSTEKWMAMGISRNPKMHDSFVIECVDESDMKIYNSYNSDGGFTNQRLRNKQHHDTVLRLVKSERIGLGMYCKFYIKKRFTRFDPSSKINNKRDFDLVREPYYIIYAWGSRVTKHGINGNLLTHKISAGQRAFTKTALASRFSPLPSQRPGLRMHANLMTIGIVFFMSIGVFTGRYFKESFVDIKIFKIPLWLFVHAVSMTISVILIVVSLGFEMVAAKGWTPLVESTFHSFGGAIALGCLIVVFGLGFFIPQSVYGKLNYGGIIHGVGGHLVYVLGVFLIILSDRVSFSGSPCSIKWIIGTWFFSYFVLNVAMSYHYCWIDWVVGLKSGRGYGILPIGVLTEFHTKRGVRSNIAAAESTKTIDAPGLKIRIGCFIIFFTLALFYSAWVVYVMQRNRDGKKDCFSVGKIHDLLK